MGRLLLVMERLAAHFLILLTAEGSSALRIAAPYAGRYLIGLLMLVGVAVFPPIPFVVLGIGAGIDILVVLSGLWWAIWTALLSMAAAPIALVLDASLAALYGSVSPGGTPSRAGERFVRIVLAVLVAELCIALYAAMVPLHNNPAAIPYVITLAVLLGLSTMLWGPGIVRMRWVVPTLAGAAFLFFTTIFFLPDTAKAVRRQLVSMDAKLANCVDEEGLGCLAPKAGPKDAAARQISSRRRPLQGTRGPFVFNLEPGKLTKTGIYVPKNGRFEVCGDAPFIIVFASRERLIRSRCYPVVFRTKEGEVWLRGAERSATVEVIL